MNQETNPVSQVTLYGVVIPEDFTVADVEIDRPYEGYVGISGLLAYRGDYRSFAMHRALDSDSRMGGASFLWHSTTISGFHEEVERWWKLPYGTAEPITEMCVRAMDAATVLVLSDDSEDLSGLTRQTNEALKEGAA